MTHDNHNPPLILLTILSGKPLPGGLDGEKPETMTWPIYVIGAVLVIGILIWLYIRKMEKDLFG